MSLTSKSIRMILEIKNPNIIFAQDAVIEEIQGTNALFFYAELKTQPERCHICGFMSKVVRYGFERSCILAPSYTYRPTYLKLSRQRFRCELCRSVFQSEADYVRPHSTISTPVRQMVLFEALSNYSLTDISRRFHVADKTAERIIDEESAKHMMRDRGIFVHHTTLMRWVQHYSPIMRALWRKRHRRTSKSWRMDETYIKIKGQWNYLYRAIDDQGLTIDFQLRKKRDFNSAYHFLKRLLKTYGLPHRLVTDQYGATLKAIKKLTREGYLHKGVHQCSKYRNNLIEQDHRFIKRQQVRSASYQSTRTAARTLYGIETMHAIHKKSRKKLGLFGFSAYQEVDQLLAA